MKIFKTYLAIFIMFRCGNCLFADTIKISADPWCPYSCEAKSQKPGFMIELTQLLFKAHGHEVIYQNTNWARALKEANDGTIDGVAGALPTEAPELVFPKLPLGIGIDAFYVRKGDPWRYKTVDSLLEGVLAVVNDYNYETKVDEYIKKHRSNPQRVIVTAGEDTLHRNIEMLKKHRVRFLIESQWVVDYNGLQNQMLTKDIELASPIQESEIFVAFSPKNPKSKIYANLIDEELPKLRANGKLSALLQSYGLKDWAKL
jgi:polar amino acid transport system substrate-binding protein